MNVDIDRIKAAAAEQQAKDGYTWMSPATVLQLVAEVERLSALLNAPELHDFAKGIVLEAAHQRDRWGVDHDAGKTPLDWFWLIGYLSQKAAMADIAGDSNKALHHTISTAAALANWHSAISGANTDMRPGIMPPADCAA